MSETASKGEGPSTLKKGKGVDPRNWGALSDAVRLSEGSGRKQSNNQHKMTTVVSGGLPLRFWYQTSSRCIVHAFG